MKRMVKAYSGVVLFLSVLVGCSNGPDQLTETKKSLARAQHELAETKDALKKAQAESAAMKEVLERIGAQVAQREVDRTSMRTASIIGIGAQFETGPITVCVYALRQHGLVFCSRMEVEFP
jgi:septal ring factor EnvC (AmiA/AmiB activator)